MSRAGHDTPPKKIACAGCHEACPAGLRRASMHAKPAKAGAAAGHVRGLPRQRAQILTPGDPASPVNHANIPDTCGRCHGQKFITSSNGDSAQAFISYQESVHGRAIEKARRRPRCAPIATARTRFSRPTKTKSPIYKFNVPATCGKCHADVTQTFMASIHGQGIARGQRAGAGLHGLPRHPLHQEARGSELAGRRDRICRRTPARAAMKACGYRRSSACPAIGSPVLHGQLSRARFEGRLGGGRQLLKLPWRPQHSALERSALDHQPRQPRRDLRPVPQGRDPEVYAHARAPRRRHRSAQGISIRWLPAGFG